MRGLALWLLLSAGLYAQTRYARVGELAGTVETRVHPSEPWKLALRNAPLLESSWIQTGPGAHAQKPPAYTQRPWWHGAHPHGASSTHVQP